MSVHILDNNKLPKQSVQLLLDIKGFTLIEMIIILAVSAVLLTIAIPTYSNYSIRANISEALSQTEAAKIAAELTCRKDRSITSLDEQNSGFHSRPSKYVKNIELSGSCDAPIITLTTRATGVLPGPALTITGNYVEETEQFAWICVSTGQNIHLPVFCRS